MIISRGVQVEKVASSMAPLGTPCTPRLLYAESAMEQKRCPRCKVDKLIADFGSNGRRRPDGSRRPDSWCKTCRAECARIWCTNNRERSLAQKRAYAAANSEKIRAQKKCYYARRREEICAASRAYRRLHADERCAYNRAWRKAHPQEWREYYKTWKAANPGKTNLYGMRHKARKRGAAGCGYTTDEHIRLRWQVWGNRCWLCGSAAEATDHVKPLAAGGAHFPCNLRPICKSCNSRKRNKWPLRSFVDDVREGLLEDA